MQAAVDVEEWVVSNKSAQLPEGDTCMSNAVRNENDISALHVNRLCDVLAKKENRTVTAVKSSEYNNDG